MNFLSNETNSIHEIIVSSTAHGIPNIFRSKRIFHKIMWIIFTIASSCVCGWFVFTSVSNYLQYSVVTSIQNVYEQPAMFPTVSICCQNSQLFQQNNLSTLINKCMFNFDESCKRDPDNSFEPFYDSDFGKCYRFNSGKNMTGHSVPFLYSTIGGMDDSLILSINSTRGLIFWVHNATTPPKRELMNNHNGDIKFASSGATSDAAVERIFDEKLGEPYNNCLKDASDFKYNKTLINQINSKGEVYSQVNCLKLCFDLDYIKNNPCNCTGASLGKVWEQCYINANFSIKSCTMSFKIGFYKGKILDKCSDYCPLECNSHSFTVSVSTILIPDKTTADIFVYYRTLKYTYITQKPETSLSDVVSNVGGILGLFIGVSFLSFIEIVEIITELFFILAKSNKTQIDSLKH